MRRMRGSGFALLRKLISLAALVAMMTVIFCYQRELRDFVVDDTRFAPEIAAAAAKHGLDPALVRAMIFVESRFNPDAVGAAGELGLMQVLPSGAVADWAQRNRRPEPTRSELCGVELNLEIGCGYLARGMERYRGEKQQTELALCYYNAGAGRADRWRPANPEEDVMDRITIESTREYVGQIMKRYSLYRRLP